MEAKMRYLAVFTLLFWSQCLLAGQQKYESIFDYPDQYSATGPELKTILEKAERECMAPLKPFVSRLNARGAAIVSFIFNPIDFDYGRRVITLVGRDIRSNTIESVGYSFTCTLKLEFSSLDQLGTEAITNEFSRPVSLTAEETNISRTLEKRNKISSAL